MPDHKPLHLLAMLVACLCFVILILFTSGAFGHNIGLFVNNTVQLSQKYNLEAYYLDVTPADWTFLLCALIYFWQAVWIVYGLTTVCRRTEDSYIYVAYPVLPPILFIVFSFSIACNIAWLLIWDKEYMEVALIFVNLMACTCYICLVVSIRRLHEWGAMMVQNKLNKEIWLIRIIVQNGIALYASWGAIASVFNFAVVLTYRTDLQIEKQEIGGTVSLIILTLEIITWWALDNFLLEKYLRYIFTPYSTVFISLVGILAKNWDPTKRNAVFSAVLLGVVILVSLTKCILSIWRHYKRPMWVNSPSTYRRPMVSFEVRSLLETQS